MPPHLYIACAKRRLTRIIEQLLSRIMERFRRGLVFKAHGLLYHSTLGSRTIQKKKKGNLTEEQSDSRRATVENSARSAAPSSITSLSRSAWVCILGGSCLFLGGYNFMFVSWGLELHVCFLGVRASCLFLVGWSFIFVSWGLEFHVCFLGVRVLGLGV